MDMRSPKLQSAIELPLPASLSADELMTSRMIQEEVLSLFDECAAGLRRYLGSFGLGADVTEDLLQDVFLSLFRHLRLGRPRDNLRGWLYRVGHNLALKRRQKTLRRRQNESTWDSTLPQRLIDPAANPEEQLAEIRRRQRLHSVLRALPERERRCVYLRAEGLRYREIADTLGISLGSVAKSLARAVTRLTNADSV